jgi:SAM-dependent methyltransferase
VGGPPDQDPEGLDRLERWAAEQRTISERRQKIPEREPLAARLADRFLDRNLHTGGRNFEREHLDVERLGYLASAWRTLPRALRHVGVSADDVFIDYGCGKGRVVHQAAKRRFRKVIGVEVSASLAEAARAALEASKREHRCKDVEIVVADAREYQLPDDVTIVYFFHPFFGETLDVVLGNIIASIDRNPRRVSIIYSYPLAGHQILATDRFRLVKQLRGRLRANDNSLHRTNIYESVGV